MSLSQQICRDALAHALTSSRSEIARRISESTGGSAMLAKSFISPLERAVRVFDQQPILEWLQMVARSHPREIVRATIASALGEALAVSERMSRSGADPDLSGMIVFVRLVERDVERALELRDSYRGRYIGSHEGAIEPILAMLRARDESTCEHSLITGDWCRRIAEVLGIAEIDTDRIVVAGVLHDVGKVAIPDAILFKRSGLDETEWSVMREHACEGSNILLDIPALAEFAPMVRHHHERIDGSGYPDGLCGDEIPFGARVIAVADAYHAMTSDRPYRAALSVSDAIACLQQGRGHQWDAEIVDAMISVALASRAQASDADLADLKSDDRGRSSSDGRTQPGQEAAS